MQDKPSAQSVDRYKSTPYSVHVRSLRTYLYLTYIAKLRSRPGLGHECLSSGNRCNLPRTYSVHTYMARQLVGGHRLSGLTMHVCVA